MEANGDGTVLRGAAVAVDAHRVVQALVAAGVAGLATAAALLFWIGARHNSRITSLREDGVAVTATVSQCRGLMGGSGSNAAGYECTGSFALGGRRYQARLPDGSLHATGSTVRVISAPGDPTLLATPAAVASGHTSGSVFVLPAVLLIVLLVVTASAVAVARSEGCTARWLRPGRSARAAARTAP